MPEETVVSSVDLLQEILARVPAMSLMRFKLVSKQWMSLISDPLFVSHHTRLHAKPSISGLYLFNQPLHLKDVSLSSHASTPSLLYFEKEDGVESAVTVSDSCNGLLLLLCYRKPFYHWKHYMVCNPTTREYKLLPKPHHIVDYFHSDVLVFDPLISPHYKVVLVSWRGTWCRLNIYSSFTASWKEVHAPVPENNILCRCLYWEGEVHWMMCTERKNNLHCRFNPDKEALEVISLPANPRIHNGDKLRYFGVCGGRLLRIQSYRSTAMGFKILEMRSGQSYWTVKHRVSLKNVFPRRNYGTVDGSFSVVYIFQGEKEEKLELMLAVGKKLVSYNIKSKVLSELTDLRVNHQRMVEGFEFIESLVEVR